MQQVASGESYLNLQLIDANNLVFLRSIFLFKFSAQVFTSPSREDYLMAQFYNWVNFPEFQIKATAVAYTTNISIMNSFTNFQCSFVFQSY